MADEIVGVELQVNGTESVKNIRTQIREATADLIRMQEEFGELSPQALSAARNVAQLRDRVQEASEVVQLFDPGKAFQSVIGVGQAIAGGFAAAQGAMALFGAESKDLEKALLKVQAAMALATGLSTVKDSLKDFQRLGAMLMQIGIVQKANAAANTLAASTMRLFGVATTQTGFAFNFLKSAIIATGIGALIVVVGTLISAISDWATAATRAAEAQKELDQAAADSSKEYTTKLLEANRNAEALAVARAKAEGKSADEIRAIQRRASEDRVESLKWGLGQLEKDEKAWDETNRTLMKERDSEQIKDYERQAARRDDAEKKAKEQRDKAAAARKAADEKAKAERKSALEAALQAEKQTADEIFTAQHTAEENELHALQEKMQKRLEIERKAGRDTSDIIVAWALERGAIEKKYLDERAKAQADDDAKKREARRTELDGIIAAQDEQTKREDEYAQKRKEIRALEVQTRIQQAAALANALSNASQVVGEETQAGKFLAAASAGISAILGAQQAFTSLAGIPYVGPALGVAAAAAALAAGYKNVQKIYAVQIPGQAGGGGSGSALSGISSSSPLLPTGSTSQPVQIDQNQVNQMGNAFDGRVYVLESDITKSQKRVARLEQAATFK